MCKECSPKRADRADRMEHRAQAIGDLQKFVVGSPLFPAACVVSFFLLIMLSLWSVNAFVEWLL